MPKPVKGKRPRKYVQPSELSRLVGQDIDVEVEPGLWAPLMVTKVEQLTDGPYERWTVAVTMIPR